MPCMVCTTCPTTSPPLAAMLEALCASWPACLALSAFCRTVAVSCSMLAAVSCSEAACCSVRADKSLLPAEISLIEAPILCEPSRISVMAAASCCCICRIACSKLVLSRASTSTVKSSSPAAILVAIAAA